MRKNILILGHGYATQFIDVYNQYCRLFDPEQYEVTIVYLTGKPDEEVRKRTLAREVIFLDSAKNQISGLKIQPIFKLLNLCRQKCFQIVICHRYKPSYIMMWVAKFYQIPLLIFVMHELKTMVSRRRQCLIALMKKKNMLFAGVSNAVRDDLQQSLWCVTNKKIVTLYNAMDIELTEPQLFSRQEARQRLQLDEQDIVFGNVARLAPNKDHKTLIQAFSLIKPHCPKAKLVIIGNGKFEDSLKEYVHSLNLSGDIIFTGYLAGGFQYMKAFDCFVLSSIQEAFGRVLLEAMVAKIPVIATAANGIPEVVGQAGTIIQPKDVHGLAEAMKTIYHLSPIEREKCGKNAYSHLVKNFSLPAFQHQFWQAASTILEKE